MDFKDHQTREGRLAGIARDYTPMSETTKAVLALLAGLAVGVMLAALFS